MTLLDFTKALDPVNYRILCLKLRAYGITFMVADWVQALLSNRHFKGQESNSWSAAFAFHHVCGKIRPGSREGTLWHDTFREAPGPNSFSINWSLALAVI